jgi:voltage-gated potassium channel
VQPYSSAGLRIANLVLKPQVADYLDIVSTAGGDELRFEEITVEATCQAVGRPLRDLHIRDATGAMIVAIRRGSGAFIATPGPDEVLDTGDVLIGVGSKEEIRLLEELFAPRRVGIA